MEGWLTSPNSLKTLIKPLLPTKWRAAFRFWIEQINIKPVEALSLTNHQREQLKWVVEEQSDFLKGEFGLVAPWESK